MTMILVRLLFYRCRAYSRRDRFAAWLFDHAPVRGRFRRSVMRLGVERNR